MKKFFLILLMAALSLTSSAQNRRVADMLELPAYSNTKSYKVVFHKAYTTSFSPKHKIPNWVAWKLTKKHVETVTYKREYNYRYDPQLGRDICPDSDDYKHSGYDRGHMCPAADNRWDKVAMSECDYMSNMCPQKHELNGGKWEGLEGRCRNWAKQYGSIYVVCGPVLPENHARKRLDSGITVPEKFYKAVLRKDRKGNYYVIGYLFDQKNNYKVLSIDEIERMIGVDLFPKVPDHIERRIESKVDTSNWQHWDKIN